MKSISIILVLFILSFSVFPYPLTPDKNVSPGEYCTVEDKDFDHFRYPENIAYCRREVSSWLKDEVCKRDGVNNRRPNYTVDHIIPLSLGGNNYKTNLWCQHRDILSAPMEYYYYELVRDGKIRRLDAVSHLLRCKFHRDCGNWLTTTN